MIFLKITEGGYSCVFTSIINSLNHLFLAIPAFAESLTLEQAIDTAIQNNPQLKAAKARLGVSDAEIKTAGARPNPMVVSDNGIAEDTYRAGIEQTIELGGKRRKRIAVAKAQLTVVQSEIDQAWLELRANVRRAYTRLYLTQEQQKALEEILSGTEKLLSVSQKQEQAGDVSQLDVLQADISVVNAKNDLQTLVNQRVEARNHLNSLLNQPLDTSVALSPQPYTQRYWKPLPHHLQNHQMGRFKPVSLKQILAWINSLKRLCPIDRKCCRTSGKWQ